MINDLLYLWDILWSFPEIVWPVTIGLLVTVLIYEDKKYARNSDSDT